MCAGLCPTYWTTFGNAEKNRNGSCPQHEWDYPHFWVFNSPASRPQGPMDPTVGEGTSAGLHVLTQIKFGVDLSTRCWDIAHKPPKCKNSPLTPIVTKILFPPRDFSSAAWFFDYCALQKTLIYLLTDQLLADNNLWHFCRVTLFSKPRGGKMCIRRSRMLQSLRHWKTYY